MRFIFLSLLQNNDEKLGLICHKDIRRNSGGAQELHCMHQFHKEVKHLISSTSPHLFVPFFLFAPQSHSTLAQVAHASAVHDLNHLHRG